MPVERRKSDDRPLRRFVPTVEQLRAAIDRGETGDKVPAFDPAVAPLATDDEAAGTPPTPEQVARAYEQETSRPIRSHDAMAATWPEPKPAKRPSTGKELAIVMTVSFLLGLFWAAWNA
jgi:hypothetical protein